MVIIIQMDWNKGGGIFSILDIGVEGWKPEMRGHQSCNKMQRL